MRLLFDQNLSHRLPRLLDSLFPGSTQVRLVGLDRADDRTVREWAATQGYAIVTLDADFADLATLHGAPPKVVWLRCGNRPTPYVAELIRRRAAEILALGLDEAEHDCLELA